MNILKKIVSLIFQTPILVILLVLVIGVGGVSYYKYQESQKELAKIRENPQVLAQQEVKTLLEKVGKIVALPEGEEPTVATVTDKERLKDQPFFAKAENGDKILIYTQAKKAFLYRPSTHKLIEVAPVNIGSPSGQQAVKIVLRNGTDTSGLTNKIEPEVKKSLTDSQIVAKENASKRDYEKTVVVALNDEAKDEAEKLAKDLGVSTGSLPEGEARPKDVDILVILGKDRT